MRSNEQRLQSMHERAETLRKRAEKAYLRVSGTASALLAAFLIFLAAASPRKAGGTGNVTFAGASMLSDGVGGYVLVGVLSFFAAVFITVACIRHRSRSGTKSGPGKESGKTQENAKADNQ